jgi:hypothetical protein
METAEVTKRPRSQKPASALAKPLPDEKRLSYISDGLGTTIVMQL